MKRLEYFDYQKVAQEEHMPKAVLRRIEKDVKIEFPSDKMMYELHVLRVVLSGYWKEHKIAG